MPQSLTLSTTIGQFSSTGGRTQLRAANVRAVEPAPNLPGSEYGNLYMLVEVTGSGGGHTALYRQILNAAQTAFYEASGSLSAALLRAARSAHSVLARANEALPEAGWRAGITFAVVQGQELTIAQAGPALALVSHPKTVDQFPAQLGTTGAPLGGAERPEVKLYHTTIEPGSMLLMAQSDWLNYVTAEALAVVATAERITMAQDYLGQLAGSADLSAQLVSFGPAIAVPVGGEVLGAAAVESLSQPVTAAVSYQPKEPSLAEAAPESQTMPLAAEGMEATEAGTEGPPRRSLWPLLLALVIIPLLIGGLVAAMWWLRTPRAEAQFTQMLDGATAVLDEIESLPPESDSIAAQRLSAAQEFLDKARAMRPDDPRLAAVDQRYQEISDQVQHITPLYGVVPIWDFTESGRDLARVVAGGDSLYVLDKGRNEVYRLVRSITGDSAQPAETPVVVQKAMQVEDHVVSDLIDMTWVEGSGNQRSRLLVLDTSGGLIGYDDTYKASNVPISGQDKWQGPQLIMGYGGNLYVADVKGNQIWRYRPGAKGYENSPEAYFASGSPAVDLTDLQAIAIDGNVWLLFPDGRVLKFMVGEQQAFDAKYPQGAPKSPVDVTAPLESDRLYVTDSGIGRILEFSKAGELLRQFRPREGDILKDVRSVYLDEAAGALYILTSNQLYKANVPEPGAAPPAPPSTPMPTPTQ